MAQPTTKRIVTEATLDPILDEIMGTTLQEAKTYANDLAFGNELVASDVSLASLLDNAESAMRAKLRAQFVPRDVPDLLMVVKGAVGNGVADDSAAWAAAINAVGDAGGGRVTAPRGRTYRVQDLPLRQNVWIDLKGIKLRHPSNVTAPMFKAAPSATFTGGGIEGGELQGYNKLHHGIDFSAVTTLEHFVVDGTWARDFDRAYNSSTNDRFFVLRDSRFQYNKVGAYVTMNHPIFHFNDFRYNDIGFSGNINDLYSVGNKFNANRIGMIADSTVSGAKIQNSQFLGGAIGLNSEKGAVVDHSNSFTGVLFYGNNSGDDGLTLTGGGNMVTNCQFGYMAASGSWGGAGVRFAGASNANQDGNIIKGNLFRLNSPTGIGIGVTGTPVLRSTSIEGNYVEVSLDRQFLNLVGATFANSKFSGNSFIVKVNTTHAAGVGICEFGSLGSGGSDFVNNGFHSERNDSPAHAFRFNNGFTGSIFDQNRFRGFATPVSSSSWAGGRWGTNHGLESNASGMAVVAPGTTSVTVNHGLKHPNTVDIRFYSLSARNSLGNATKYWITNVTQSSFDIRLNVDPGSFQAELMWQINIGG